MAKIACCHNCAYSYCDHEHALWSMSVGVLTWPACANHPESYGVMRRVPQRGICSNYRAKAGKPEGDVKQIPLGDGFYAYVDAADYEWLSRWTWHLGSGYAYRVEKRKVVIYMHRQIMQPPKGMVVHHKNRNKLDNTRGNMENVTPAENTRQRAKKRNASSRFWGVSYTKSRAKYHVSVHHEGRLFACGYFADEIEAARAHDYKAVALKGEAARLNFPKEWPPERRAQVYAEFQARLKREGKNVGRKGGKTGRRSRPGDTGRKQRAMSARPRVTGDGGRDKVRRRRQKAKGRTEGPDARRTKHEAGRGGVKARAQKVKGNK